MGVYGVSRPPSLTVASCFNQRSSPVRLFNLPFNRRSIGGSRRRNRSISGLVFVNKEVPSPLLYPPKNKPKKMATQILRTLNMSPELNQLRKFFFLINQLKQMCTCFVFCIPVTYGFLQLLRKNRDMLFNEVKLTVTIEDPRDVERRRLLGIDDENAPTRDDLADALVQVNEGKIPKNPLALQMLAEEMIQWPDLEVEARKKKHGKSLYAKVTDTGVDVKEVSKRLNIDWDSAAEFENAETEDLEVPAAVVGFSLLDIKTSSPCEF